MMTPMLPDQPIHLKSRSILHVQGEDAQSFLQNIFTNDMNKVADGVLQYTLLLTPQGMVLHDVFVFRYADGFTIDVQSTRQEDLLRRLNMFKLRAKVTISVTDLMVYAQSNSGMQDPRYQQLGTRLYSNEIIPALDEVAYDDFCLSLGVPNGEQNIRYGKDFSHDVNLDKLNAFSWNKGCFIGQEVAARVENRGLVKRRLVITSPEKLQEGDDVRGTDSLGKTTIAVMRLDAIEAAGAQLPTYFPK